jgi:hypothetical protein
MLNVAAPNELRIDVADNANTEARFNAPPLSVKNTA